MPNNIILATALAAATLAVMVGPAAAQTDRPPRDVLLLPGGETPLQTVATVSGLAGRDIDVAVLGPVAGLPTSVLLAGIASWLSDNFDLPVTRGLPRVRLATPAALLAIRCGASDPGGSPRAERACGHALLPEHEHDVVALYEDATDTIYLQEGWTGATPAELSVLVHEMVHHLQNAGGLKYECADARERPAYLAQARWLGLFDQSLESEFSMDPMTLLIRTMCPR